MCGRMTNDLMTQIVARFSTLPAVIDPDPTYNAGPSQIIPVVIETGPETREVKFMHWGLISRRQNRGRPMPTPINARSETLNEKPMFKQLLATRRCLVPATGFYEWRGSTRSKQPYFIHLTDQPLFAFAGLWDDTRPDGAPDFVAGSFTIITTRPNLMVAELHDRMPVILAPDEEALWLSTGVTDPEAVLPLLDAYPEDRMEAYPVSQAVNDVRNNTPQLLDPVKVARRPAQRPLFS